MAPRPGDGSVIGIDNKSMCAIDSETEVRCVLQDGGQNILVTSTTLQPVKFSASLTIDGLFRKVANHLVKPHDRFELFLCRAEEHGQISEGEKLSEKKHMTLEQAGFKLLVENVLTISRISDEQSKSAGRHVTPDEKRSVAKNGREQPAERKSSGVTYLGLVNQAMTCYLNSMLQTLFMTPEFRNALYRWEFDGTPEEASKSLVFQLQKLFLSLETSSRHSVETTELTRSFGWDSTEVWQQHDIQELCRVMLDTLEKKFKNTDQADLIKKLYEGKMLDYVKCLECGTEKAREDVYQDIQLPIRPFGQSTTYASVEEAMQAFVQPETLNESNQYFCEKCNKKCDAHKGLKFKFFPYLLTIQMKRFEFDYSVMHRIKVNDRVSFPEMWDLSSFVSEKSASAAASGEAATNGPVASDDDVEMSETCDTVDAEHVPALAEGMRNGEIPHDADSGLTYELFSVMIHSGSATGGHYYAMIKNLESKAWYCFNDTQVTETTFEDVRRMYGGSPEGYGRVYGSGGFNTNAYMLMYRRVDPSMNVGFVKPNEYPLHICALKEAIRAQEESEEKLKELERAMLKIPIHYHRPSTGERQNLSMKVHRDQPLGELEEDAYKLLTIYEDAIPRAHCRLTLYDEEDDVVDFSFEFKEATETPVGELIDRDGFVASKRTFYMYIKSSKDEEFVPLSGNGATVWVHTVNLEKDECLGPFRVRTTLDTPVSELRERIQRQVPGIPGSDSFDLPLVLKLPDGDLKRVEVGVGDLRSLGFPRKSLVYAQCGGDPEPEESDEATPFLQTNLCKFLNRISNSIKLKIELPEVDDAFLNRLGLGTDGKPLPEEPTVIPPMSPPWRRPREGGDMGPDRIFEDDSGGGVSGPGPGPSADHGGGGGGGGGGERMDQDDPASHDSHLPDGEPGGLVGIQMFCKQLLQDPDSARRTSEAAAWLGLGKGLPASTSGDLMFPSGDRSEDSSLNDSERTMVGDGEHEGETSSTKGCPGSDQGSNCDSPAPAGYDCQLSSPEEDPLETDGLAGDNWNSPGLQSPPAVDDVTRANDDLMIRHMKVEALPDRVLLVEVDKRISVDGLKRGLAPFLRNVPPNLIRMYRTFSSSHDVLCCEIRGADQLPCKPEETVSVKLVRELGKSDCVGRVFMFKPTLDVQKDNVFHTKATPLEKHSELVCAEWVITLGQTVATVKKKLLPEIKAYTKMDVELERVRLRAKMWMDPGPVLFDHQIFSASATAYAASSVTPEYVFLHQNWELCFEVLPGPEIATSPMDFLGFLRPWRPSEFRFGRIVEFVVHEPATEVTDHVIAKKVEELFNIPLEFVELARPGVCTTCLFCERFPAAEIDWIRCPEESPGFKMALKCGAVTYFRDFREEEKTPTDDELKQMYQEDRVRNLRGGRAGYDVQNISTSTTYTPKKEVGLTIYVDGRKPEKKPRSDETD